VPLLSDYAEISRGRVNLFRQDDAQQAGTYVTCKRTSPQRGCFDWPVQWFRAALRNSSANILDRKTCQDLDLMAPRPGLEPVTCGLTVRQRNGRRAASSLGFRGFDCGTDCPISRWFRPVRRRLPSFNSPNPFSAVVLSDGLSCH